MMPNRAVQTAHNEEQLAAEGILQLKSGAAAPALIAAGTAGEFTLATQQTAGGRTVLFFFPAPNTPNSTRELLQYTKDQTELSTKQITIYGLTGASVEELAAFRGKYGIGVELLADPGLTIAQAYGCALPGGKYPQRTTIGINPDGTIAFYTRHQMLKADILKGFGLK